MKHVIYILALILLSACYDDKGNYDYEDINKIVVGLDEMYAFRLDKDTTVTITPRLAQSMQKNKENLKYVWLHSTINHNFYGRGSFDTVGLEESLKFHINPEEKKISYRHYFRLNVYDELTGIEYPVNTTIKLIKPYDGAWMVLHSMNGQTELGAVEYMGTRIQMTEDAFYQETGKRLQGAPLCLGQFRGSNRTYGTGSGWLMFSIITDNPQEAGLYHQWKKFEKVDSLVRMVAPTAKASFNYQKVGLIEGGKSWGAICLSDGVLYQSPSAMKIYKANVDLEGPVKVTLGCKVAFDALLYDEAGHRFAYYSNTGGGSYDPKIFSEDKENNAKYALRAIPVRDGNVNLVDPNQLPADQKVVYVGAGYQFEDENRAFYGYGVSLKGQDSCFVYEFNINGIMYADEGSSFTGYYRLKMPKGMDENSRFASTRYYSGILFYTSGNTVYRLDFKQAGGKATPVYTHTGGKAVQMKFARVGAVDTDTNYEVCYTDYEFDVNRSLGIVFDMGGGKSEFVVLNLSPTGSIGTDSESYPAQQVFPGFGEIKDFVFI